MIYADTNVLVRHYLETSGSENADRLMAQARAVIPITWLLELELTNAIELSVHVSRTTGFLRVSPEMAAAAQTDFETDLNQGRWLQRHSLPWNLVQSRFRELSLRHTARHGFRTYDLLHVASALILGCEEFWSFDNKARMLAGLEGLKLNPLPGATA